MTKIIVLHYSLVIALQKLIVW